MNYENYDPYFPNQPVVDQYLPMWADLPAFRAKPAFIWAENGSTSGKVQRWLPKDKLLGGKMNVVLQIKFEDNDQYSTSPKRLLHEGEGKHMGKRMKDNQTAGACPQSHNSIHPSLLSSL